MNDSRIGYLCNNKVLTIYLANAVTFAIEPPDNWGHSTTVPN